VRPIGYGGVWLAVLGLVLGGGAAHAQELAGLQLSWSGPASCAAPPRLQGEVAELLGRDFQLSSAAEARVQVRAIEAGYSLQLEVRTQDGIGRRELSLPSCDEAQKAAPLLIALSLNPDLVPPGETPEPEPAPAPAPAPDEPEPAPDAVEAPPWGVGLSIGVDTATRSTASPIAQLRARWQRRWFQAAADVALVAPLTDSYGSEAVELRSGVWAVGLGACAGPNFGAFYLAGCAGLELGQYWASSQGVAVENDDSALWSAARLGGQLAYTIGRFALQLEVLGSVPLTRPVLALDDLGVLHTTAPASLRASLGLLVLLGSVDSPSGGQYH